MIGLSFKNITKRKIRSIMTALGVLAAMLLFITLTSITNLYEEDLQRQVTGMAGRIMVQASESGDASFYPMDSIIKESAGRDILATDGVDVERSTMVLYQSLVPQWKPSLPPIMGVGIEPGREPAYFGGADAEGSSRLEGSHDVILGTSAAGYFKDRQNAGLGDEISIKGQKYRIIGLLPEINSVVDCSMIMPLSTAQDVYVRPGLINAVIVTSKAVDLTDGIAASIESRYPTLIAATSEEMKKSAVQMLAALQKFMKMISDTIIVVAVIIIMIVMFMTVNEKRKEIGTLKAIGASRKDIMGMIVAESLVLSLVGGLLALPASIFFIRAIAAEYIIDFGMWAQTLAVVAVLGVLSGLLPALSAQRVNPLESLRYE